MRCAIGDWVDAATAAMIDVVSSVLGWPAAVAVDPGAPFDAPFGAYVPLSSADSMIQLGVVAELSDCKRISRALLGMSDEEPFGSENDVADAIGEIVNMVAGSTKTRMHTTVPDIVLGLPLCVRGTIETPVVERVASELLLGDVRARVVLFRDSHPGARIRPRAQS